tara:strand:- start:2405 stop:2575 length:171 start_codon:yes stop_codon:yes gene_type:complete
VRNESQKQREQRLSYNQMFYYEGDDDPYDDEKKEEEEVLEFCPECHSKPCSCSDNI